MEDLAYHMCSEFDELVKQCMSEWKVPGLAIAIVAGDDIEVKNYGESRLSETRVSDRTLFDCASTSKSFTAAALALIVSDDEKYPEVQWKTPVSRLLPEDFVMSDPLFTQNVTIEDILSHRSGLPGHDDSPMGVQASDPDTPRSMTRNLRNLKISRGLREEYQYSNIMFTVASHLIETVTQMPFGEFLRVNFWTPLGMDHTYMGVCEVKEHGVAADLAKPYAWAKERDEYLIEPWFDQPEGQGAGSIFSCVGDYAKWVRCRLHQSPPLSKAAHQSLDTPRIVTNPDFDLEGPFRAWSHTLYSLGYEIRSFRGHLVIGHDGSVPGFESAMLHLPDQNWGVVAFGNESSTGLAIEAIVNTLLNRVIGTPTAHRTDWLKAVRHRQVEAEDVNKQYWNRSWTDEELMHEAEPMTPVSELIGKYHNAGYHGLNFVLKDDLLFADCTDRSYPHFLTLRHVKGNKFTAEYADATGDSCLKRKAMFRCNDDGTHSFGWDIVEELPDEFVWFDHQA